MEYIYLEPSSLAIYPEIYYPYDDEGNSRRYADTNIARYNFSRSFTNVEMLLTAPGCYMPPVDPNARQFSDVESQLLM